MSELLAQAERVAAQARAGEQIEAFAARSRTTSVKAYNGAVEAFTSAESMGMGIRVIRNGCQGFAYVGSLDDDAVAAALDDARDNVTYGEYDEHNGLAVPDGVAAVTADVWFEELVSFPAERKIELAIDLERRVRGGDARIYGVRVASFADSAGESAVASSTGLSATTRGTFCSLSVSALAREGDSTTIGGGSSLARVPSELDFDKAANDAVLRATRMLGATKPKSQRVAIVLEPRIAAMLLGIVGGTLCGDAVVKKRSPFADRFSDVVASPLLTLIDDATDTRSFNFDSFDGEGLACRPTVLIDEGRLNAFLHNSYTARRTGGRSTANAVRGIRSTPQVAPLALQVRPGSQTAEQMLAGVDRGVFVQSMNGLHSGVNPTSGDFSVGVEGLMIESGALAGPIREATLGSSIQRLLTDIVALGSDLEWQPSGMGTVSLVIDGVTLSGT